MLVRDVRFSYGRRQAKKMRWKFGIKDVKGVRIMLCDRCFKKIDSHEDWGNCTICGENLCERCAEEWNDEGECLYCQEKREAREIAEKTVKNINSAFQLISEYF